MLVPTTLTYAVIVLSQQLRRFVLIHFNSSAHNPATSSVTAVIISLPKISHLFWYKQKAKQFLSDWGRVWLHKAHEHVNSAVLLRGIAQLDYCVAVCSVWSILTSLFPASWTSYGAISLPGETEETIWRSFSGVIPGSHLPSCYPNTTSNAYILKHAHLKSAISLYVPAVRYNEKVVGVIRFSTLYYERVWQYFRKSSSYLEL